MTDASPGPEQVAPNAEEPNTGAVVIAPVSSVPGVYANYVGVIRTQNDVVLDFFTIEPGANTRTVAVHVSRVFVPLTLLKGLREALGEQIQGYEEQWGFELPNMRSSGIGTGEWQE
jgi:hypothetical protein